MKAYHFAKTREAYEAILRERTLKPGKNLTDPRPLVHLALDPIRPGRYALDTMGPDTNEAWIFELEIPDNTQIEEDHAEDLIINVIQDSEGRAWEMHGSNFFDGKRNAVSEDALPSEIRERFEEIRNEKISLVAPGFMENYGFRSIVHEGDLPVKILGCVHVSDVREWEGGVIEGETLSVLQEQEIERFPREGKPKFI